MASNSNTPINNTSAPHNNTSAPPNNTPTPPNNTSAPHNTTPNNNAHDNTPNINNTTSNTSNNNSPSPYPAVIIDHNRYISNTSQQSSNIAEPHQPTYYSVVDDYDSDSSVRSIASVQKIFTNISSKDSKGKSKQNQSKQNPPY